MNPRAVLAILLLAAAVRAATAAFISFPALDDPAYYLTVARNLAAGRGLTIDAIWSYQFPFAQVAHSSNEYWMPYTSLALWPVFALAGPEFRAAQAVGVLAGSLLVVPAMLAAAALASERSRAGTVLLAGALAALNPLLIYQAAVPDSAALFSLAAGAGLLLLGVISHDKTARERSEALAAAPSAVHRQLFVAGLLLGLGYLARADGLLLLPVGLWFAGMSGRNGRGAAIWTAGFLAVAAPWWVRQWLAFGSPFPVPALVPALVLDYPTMFSWPAPTAAQLWQDASVAKLLALRWDGLWHNSASVLLPALGALAPFTVTGLRAAWNAPILRPTLAGGAVLFLGSALLFPVPTMAGTFYHSVGAALPVLIGVGAAGMAGAAAWWEQRRGWRRSALPLLATGAMALTGAQTALLARQAAEMHAGWERQFAAAGHWFTERGAGTGAVMTSQPHTLNYATGLPAVMLPAAQPPAVALEVARRYGARYLLLTERFGVYPAAMNPPSPGFSLVHDADGIQIYDLGTP